MPRPGQKSITVSQEVYEKAKKMAEREGLSIAGWVSRVILERMRESPTTIDTEMVKEAMADG